MQAAQNHLPWPAAAADVAADAFRFRLDFFDTTRDPRGSGGGGGGSSRLLLGGGLDEKQRWVAVHRSFHGIIRAVQNIAPASFEAVPDKDKKESKGNEEDD